VKKSDGPFVAALDERRNHRFQNTAVKDRRYSATHSQLLTPGICHFVPCIFFLTSPPPYGSLSWLSQESGGKGRRQRKAKGTRARGKKRGNGKKILNRGNELSHLWQIKDLAFWSAQNELVFDANELKTNPKKGAKNHHLRGFEVEFAAQKAPRVGELKGGLHELRIPFLPLNRNWP
jgi:hypothetical protein